MLSLSTAEPLSLVLAGNPNCGKTTLFNRLTGLKLKTANWHGVTVKTEAAAFLRNGQQYTVSDTPGTYSLTGAGVPEAVAVDVFSNCGADVIVNVIDAVLLERSLFLTLQLLKLGCPVIVALNMMDIAAARGIKINAAALSAKLGVPVIPISAKTGSGLPGLFDAVNSAAVIGRAAEGKQFSPLDADESFKNIEVLINDVLAADNGETSFTDRLDRFLTHRFFGVLFFFAVMAVVFFLTFALGDLLRSYIVFIIDRILLTAEETLMALSVSEAVTSLVCDGIIGGVGGVVAFLPNISVLFILLALLEDSGYMARAALVLNSAMSKAGLPGRAAIPLLLGLGCSVPAVMSSKIVEGKSQRIRTILATPFMSCSARLPVYVLFASAFFGDAAPLAVFSMYIIGALTAFAAALLLKLFTGKEDNTPLLLELPDYKLPDMRSVYNSVTVKLIEYLGKAGTVIFSASVIMWLMTNIGIRGFTGSISESFAASIGKAMVPLMAPLGLGSWQLTVSLISGIAAKEVIVSSLAITLGIQAITTPAGVGQLARALENIGFTPAAAFSMMLFTLLYVPCAATLAAIKKETGSLKLTCLSVLLQFSAAWLLSAALYSIIGRFLP